MFVVLRNRGPVRETGKYSTNGYMRHISKLKAQVTNCELIWN